MKRMLLVVIAAALVAALVSLRTADAQTPDELSKRITLLDARVVTLEKQVSLLNAQMAELRGPIHVSATAVEIQTGTFTVAAGKISLRASGELELKGAKISQN